MRMLISIYTAACRYFQRAYSLYTYSHVVKIFRKLIIFTYYVQKYVTVYKVNTSVALDSIRLNVEKIFVIVIQRNMWLLYCLRSIQLQIIYFTTLNL